MWSTARITCSFIFQNRIMYPLLSPFPPFPPHAQHCCCGDYWFSPAGGAFLRCAGAERTVENLQAGKLYKQYHLNNPLSLVLFLLHSGTLWEFWTRPLARWKCMTPSCSTCSHCFQVGPCHGSQKCQCFRFAGWVGLHFWFVNTFCSCF